jgi:ankyrin repeat protein
MAAADVGGEETLIKLIQAGADVNAVETTGLSALLLAAQHHPDYVPTLLRADANANARTADGRRY